MYKTLTCGQYCLLEEVHKKYRRAGVPHRIKRKIAREFHVNVERISAWFLKRKENEMLHPEVIEHLIIIK